MLIFDIDTLQILEVNTAAILHYGYSRQEFLSLSTRDLRVSEERGSFDKLKGLFKGSENVFAEGQHLLRSGSVINVQIVSYIVEYKQKKCRLAHINDVTSVVRQARNFEILVSIGQSISQELELQSIIQKVTDASLQLSGADFGILFYYPAQSPSQVEFTFALSTISIDVQRQLGDIKQFQSLITNEVVRVASASELEIGSLKLSERVGIRKEENPWTFQSFMSVPITSKSGETIGSLMLGHRHKNVFTEEAEKMVLGVVSQATVALDNAMLFQKLVSANDEKERLLEKATEQNFKKDEFLSVASHELKTPVTSMKGYLQILEKQLAKEGNQLYLDLLQKANKQVNKIIHLVGDLLNLSKLEAGRLEYNFSNFKISEVLADCITNIKNAERKHNIRVFGDQSSVICADRNRIEQVIINLIDNAIKYSPEATEVLIGLSEERGYFKLEVRDFGPGIPEEKLRLIFERYYRGEENSYKTSGLGLGLYISNEIIKRHQGRMGVESEQGKGSTFSFIIPTEQDLEGSPK